MVNGKDKKLIFAKKVVDSLSKLGLQYGDVRVQSNTVNQIVAENNRIERLDLGHDNGFGVRVIYNGHWGFAASPIMDDREIEKVVKKAYYLASMLYKSFGKGPFSLSPIQVVTDSYSTPYVQDPFEVPMEEKSNYLLDISQKFLKIDSKIKKSSSWMFFEKKNQIFASTEGSMIQGEHLISSGGCTAVASGDGKYKTRSFMINPASAGYEVIKEKNMLNELERVGKEAVDKLYAKELSFEKRDIILDPQHLALTIHESVGHPTELDRVLGYEMSLAGDSFATPEKLNSFQYAAPIVNFMADNTLQRGLASSGYDDEGVKCSKWYMIKDGILSGYSTNRETALALDLVPGGTARAENWSYPPIVRIPNLSLLPGKDRLSLEDLISDTKDGVYIQGRGSFSIDQKRINFQFGGDAFWEIKNGKIVGMLTDIIYQSTNPEFWSSCDAICDERAWEQGGIMTCGKGDPCQIARMTHGAAPARFKNILIGTVK